MLSVSAFCSFSTDFPVSRADKGPSRKHDLSITPSMCSIERALPLLLKLLVASCSDHSGVGMNC